MVPASRSLCLSLAEVPDAGDVLELADDLFDTRDRWPGR